MQAIGGPNMSCLIETYSDHNVSFGNVTEMFKADYYKALTLWSNRPPYSLWWALCEAIV